ncbi:MAG: ATP-binding protein [Candidatus Zixiibacteriota bacterium]
MFSPLIVTCIIGVYTAALFILARYAEARKNAAFFKTRAATIYTMSIAVYCTTWTYYGSIGKAVTSGPLYLAIYIGPTIAISLWWIILRKLYRAKNQFGISSIADFLSVRYGKSQLLAIIVTVFVIVGISPYLALQLKAITVTFEIITMDSAIVNAGLTGSIICVIVALLMILFTIIFGARNKYIAESHEGLVFVIAVESIIKLVIFLSIGIFAVFYLTDGFEDVHAMAITYFSSANNIGVFTKPPTFATWLTYLFLAMGAIVFLPRQFQVLIVENTSLRHIKKAIWLYPLYMFLINLFVIPLAVVGISYGLNIAEADFFLLRLPMLANNSILTLLCFLGGFSAATGMIIVSSLNIATMITNHIFVPIVQPFRQIRNLGNATRWAKWLAIAFVVMSGYVCERFLGNTFTLVNMGMLSFAAAFQFVPSVIGGLFWRKGNKQGAILGICVGFLIWGYTLLYPSIIKSGGFGESILLNGAFGLNWLRPESLFGINNINPLTHGVLWSILLNSLLYITGSLLCRQSTDEERTANAIVGTLNSSGNKDTEVTVKTLKFEDKLPLVISILNRYFTNEESDKLVTHAIKAVNPENLEQCTITEYADIISHLEKHMAEHIGVAAANKALNQHTLFSNDELVTLQHIYQRVMLDMNLTPSDMAKRIDIYRERQKLIARNAELLEKQVEARTHDLVKANMRLQDEISEREKMGEALLEHQEEIRQYADALEQSNQELQDFAFVASHDLQEPLRKIRVFGERLDIELSNLNDQKAKDYLTRIIGAAERMQGLIKGLLEYSRITTGAQPFSEIDLNDILKDVLSDLEVAIEDNGATVTTEHLPNIEGDALQIRQLFQNLIGNALKYAKPDVTPIISVKNDSPQGIANGQIDRITNHCCISISDNGIGFDVKFSKKIFQPFQRLQTRHQYPGTGIGLAVCKKIVERHNGVIDVLSIPGEGSTFAITLPITHLSKESRHQYADSRS